MIRRIRDQTPAGLQKDAPGGRIQKLSSGFSAAALLDEERTDRLLVENAQDRFRE